MILTYYISFHEVAFYCLIAAIICILVGVAIIWDRDE